MSSVRSGGAVGGFDSFLSALAENGLAPVNGGVIRPDGQIHKFEIAGDKLHRASGWAVYHEGDPPHGAAGSHRTGAGISWSPTNSAKLSKAEHEKIKRRIAREREKRERERRKVAREERALWKRLKPASRKHAYLKRKKVGPGPCRVENGWLVVPIYSVKTGKIISLQRIDRTGKRKLTSKGGRMRGGYCRLGDFESDEPLVICEGFATGQSITEATGWPVALALMCGNLPAVASAMRKRYTEREIVIAADNDANTDGNPGVTKATEAARAIDATLPARPSESIARVQGPQSKSQHQTSTTSRNLGWVGAKPGRSSQTTHKKKTSKIGPSFQ